MAERCLQMWRLKNRWWRKCLLTPVTAVVTVIKPCMCRNSWSAVLHRKISKKKRTRYFFSWRTNPADGQGQMWGLRMIQNTSGTHSQKWSFFLSVFTFLYIYVHSVLIGWLFHGYITYQENTFFFWILLYLTRRHHACGWWFTGRSAVQNFSWNRIFRDSAVVAVVSGAKWKSLI